MKVMQQPDGTWCVCDADGTPMPGECYPTEAEAQAALDAKTTPPPPPPAASAKGPAFAADPAGLDVEEEADQLAAENPVPADVGVATAPGGPPQAGGDVAALNLAWRAVLAVAGDTDDRRSVKALSNRELPLTLLALCETPDFGHTGAVVCGRIDSIELVGRSAVAEGVFTDDEVGLKIAKYVNEQVLRGVSIDASGEWEIECREYEVVQDPLFGDLYETCTEPWESYELLTINAATVCATPAFAGATIRILDDACPDAPTMAAAAEALVPPPAGPANAITPVEDEVAEGLAASAVAVPVAPPRAWFDDPGLERVTPLSIDAAGRVFGHIAAWGTCHIGLEGRCVTPPHSEHDYAYFHTGALLTGEGDEVAVGRLTMNTGHADLHLNAAASVRHYDDTGVAVADVRVGEDAHGVWCAGAVRPGTRPEDVRVLRASPPSGDWRWIAGAMELVAVLSVNVPGFPVVRAGGARVHERGREVDRQTALVAAGAVRQPQMTPGAGIAAVRAEVDRLRRDVDLMLENGGRRMVVAGLRTRIAERTG